MDLYDNAISSVEEIKKPVVEDRHHHGEAYYKALRKRFIKSLDTNIDVLTNVIQPQKGMSHMYKGGKLVPKTGRMPIVIWNKKNNSPVFGWDVGLHDAVKILKQLKEEAEEGNLDYVLRIADWINGVRLKKHITHNDVQDVFAILYKDPFMPHIENADMLTDKNIEHIVEELKTLKATKKMKG